jgi:predicted GNAT family acetyltransferase
MLEAKHYRSPGDFLDRTGARLEAEALRFSLILGVCNRVAKDLHEYGAGDPWFLTLEEDGEVTAIALRTPPFEVLVAAFAGDPLQIAERLVAEIGSVFDKIPGVVGEPEIANPAAHAWCGTHGIRIKHTMQQRVYSLSAVEPIPTSPGRLRQAVEADTEIVIEWMAGFQKDTFGHVEDPRTADRVAKMLARGDAYLWEDGEPVSIAAKTRPAGDSITIGMVYTPPDLRNRRYASSCVAALCKLLLESGYRHCSLYTDLSNPTSNKIYKRIGFTEVCDSVGHTFEL